MTEVINDNNYKKATDDEKTKIINEILEFSKEKAKVDYAESKGIELSSIPSSVKEMEEYIEKY